jgi:cyanophycinase
MKVYKKTKLLVAVLLGMELHPACSDAQSPLPEPVEVRVPGLLGRVGSAQDKTVPELKGGYLLAGGSTDVDAAMQWFAARAAGGDIVILRATGSTGYNRYLFDFGGVNSVSTFLVNSRALAENDTLVQAVRKAEAVFIAGGDQGNYIRYWKNTALMVALNEMIVHKNIAIGGTSAGCAVLGGHIFSALQGTAVSDSVLTNPFHATVALETGGFLGIPSLRHIVTDQHYTQRGRQGRHLVFMARLFQAEQPVFGIGVDEKTAVAIDETGKAMVFGDNDAWFLTSGPAAPEQMETGKPLIWNRDGKAVTAVKISAGVANAAAFNTLSWVPLGTNGVETGWLSVAGGKVVWLKGTGSKMR